MASVIDLQLPVFDELKEVRKFGLGKLDGIDRKTDASWTLTPYLELAARNVVGHSDRMTRSQAIKLLLRVEIEKIGTHHPCRVWLPTSFGLTPETEGKLPSKCREAARSLVGEPSKNRWERSDGGIEQEGIGILAAQIVADCLLDIQTAADGGDPYDEISGAVDLEETSIITVAPRVDPSAGSRSDYVVRQSIHDQFDAAVDAGARIIALVGHAGYGKTRLADALVRSRSGEFLAPCIGIRGTDLLSADLFGLIARLGIDPVVPTWDIRHASSPREIGQAFAALVNDDRSPDFIVLDCRQARRLPGAVSGMHSARSRFILTCLPGFPLPEDATVIEVGPLEDAEAIAILRSRVPGIPTSDVARLVPELHGYPSAIVYVAKLYARGIVPVENILSILRCRADVFYQNVPFPDGVTITSIANQIIETVANENSLALKLLECMVFLERTDYVSRRFLEQYAALADLVSTPSPFPASNALDTLAKLQLIEVKRDVVRLKPQVRAALYRIMEPKLWVVARHFITYFRQYEDASTAVLRLRPTKSDTIEFLREYDRAALAICHVFDVFAELDSTRIPCPSEFGDYELSELALYYHTILVMLREGVVAKGWIHSAKSVEELTKTWTFADGQAMDEHEIGAAFT